MAMQSIVNLTVGKVGQLLVNEGTFLIGVKDQVKSIERELRMMQAFLKDMEALEDEGSITTTTSITAKEITSLAYEVEDVIDTYILEANPADFKESPSFKKYLCCLVTTHQVGTAIGDIQTKIAQTMEMLKKYRVDNGLPAVGGSARKKGKSWRPTEYAHTSGDHVVGIEEDTNNLVRLLTTNESEDEIQVLSIAGMGGCGKTTVVRKLYNNESVKKCFDCIAWVTISQQWVTLNGLLDILQKISGESMKINEGQGHGVVGVRINEFLKGKKYLIVLDDVWEKNDLKEILATLPFEGGGGSKVIVTTRSPQIVDDTDHKTFTHEPKRLTDEESWELFEKITGLKSTNPEFGDLKELGEEMLKKCKGLPLAVVALAGILAKKKRLEEWERVKEDVSSRVLDEGEGKQSYGSVRDMLELSYKDLPLHLKPCFLYFGLFPEDSWIPVGMLTRMWVAEGFISSANLHKGETLEDLARGYLDELVGRCVVRVVETNYDGKPKIIEIHDLMRDLCMKKAKEIDFLQSLSDTDDSSPNPDTTTITPTARRTAVHSYNNEEFSPFSTENPHLRSLFLLATNNVRSYRYLDYMEKRSVLGMQPILEKFKLLRVLHLLCIHTSDATLPKEIGSLVHLRYFFIRGTNICKLPSSIGNLRNLLTLEYRGVILRGVILNEFKLEIPNVVWKIQGMRHLYLDMYRKYTMEGLRVDTLHHLQTLWVGAGPWMLDQLPKLSKTVRKLKIDGIESNEELEAAFKCPSITLDCLHKLDLIWRKGIINGDQIVLRNLEPIVNSRHLRHLSLKGRIDDILGGGIQFPGGIKFLHLENSKLEGEATVEALGRLPNLNVLHLTTDSYIGSKWSCSEGTFPQLKKLLVIELPKLEEWRIERGAMCQLKKLWIENCNSLMRLPEGLEFMTSLKELYLDGMPEEFHSRIRKEGGEDYHLIQHIPLVRTASGMI